MDNQLEITIVPPGGSALLELINPCERGPSLDERDPSGYAEGILVSLEYANCVYRKLWSCRCPQSEIRATSCPRKMIQLHVCPRARRFLGRSERIGPIRAHRSL